MESSSFGQRLKALREQAGLAQADLAARAGLVPPVLSAYENGRREPRVDVFFRLVDAAGYRVEFVPDHDDWAVPDAREKAQILEWVAAIAMALPHRERGELTFPPFRTLGVDA